MTADRYWLSTPGSKDPPRGPMDLGAIEASWRSGSLPPETTICKVGESTWVRADGVVGVVATTPQVVERLAVRRAALTTGAKALQTNSTIFQILALVMLVSGVATMMVPQDSLVFPKWQVVMGVVAAAAPFAYATGIVLGALSDVLLALRDRLDR